MAETNALLFISRALRRKKVGKGGEMEERSKLNIIQRIL